MDWKIEGRPLVEAVARAIKENDGEHVSAETVNAQLEQPLEEARLDRRLGELREDGFIEGPTINERAAPILISMGSRGRQEVSGWPSGQGGLSILDSTIENFAMRDININNLNVANFFDAWEQRSRSSTRRRRRRRRRATGCAWPRTPSPALPGAPGVD
jgi:hypothetical protein